MIQTSLSFDELHDGVENVLLFFFWYPKIPTEHGLGALEPKDDEQNHCTSPNGFEDEVGVIVIASDWLQGIYMTMKPVSEGDFFYHLGV